MSGLEVAPIKLFKLSQYYSGFVCFEAIIANVVIRIRGGRQENQGTILDRAKTVLFSTASETYLRHSQSRNQRVPENFTTALSDVTVRLSFTARLSLTVRLSLTARLSLTCVYMVQSHGGAVV